MTVRRTILRSAGVFWFLTSVMSAPLTAGEFTFGDRTLRVPDGFEVQRIAGPDLAERPIAVSRDERGRLYVTDSGGMSERAEKQLELKPHSIRRLEDTNGDGVYDKSTLFADGMMFPEGCLWFRGSLYVAAPPQIWRLKDTDDDGKADEREIWYDGKTLTGCANDLHGPYLGLDGWMYWCKGAFAEQKKVLPNGKPFVTRSSHIFRCRPDGKEVEPVLTGGMDNAVNVAFLSNGDRILSCTFFQFPEAGKRDGLLHAVYGGVYGKKHDSIYEHKQTGDVMPVLVHEGAAAPCGLTAGSRSLFGGGHLDQLFACYFNLHKVVRHQLIPDGATYKTEDEDFLACDHPDFHPTDVQEDADGSLIVVDTGGWYKVCCPTSQLAKPDVLGAIYRIRKKDQPKVDDPLGLKLDWKVAPEKLVPRLIDERLFVRRRAADKLRGTAIPDALYEAAYKADDAELRKEALWTLARIDEPYARNAVRLALKDRDPDVARIAIQIAGQWRDKEAKNRLMQLVVDRNVTLQRAAAEALGRIGDPEAIIAIEDALQRIRDFTPDESGAPAEPAMRVLEHSLIYALIEIGDAKALQNSLQQNPGLQRPMLVALDQIDESPLTPEQVVPLLDSRDAVLRNTATWIVGHRPAWGPQLVSWFQSQLEKLSDDEKLRELLPKLMARLAKSPAVQQFLADQLRDAKSTEARSVVLQAMSDAGLTAAPPLWLEELARRLPDCKTEELPQTLTAARTLPMPKTGHPGLKAALIAIGRREEAGLPLRIEALSAVGPLSEVDTALFQTLTEALSDEQPPGVRGAAASILGSASLSAQQQGLLVEKLRTAGPIEASKLLPAFEKSPTEPLGVQLVAALSESQGLSGLRFDQVSKLLEKYPQTVREAGAPLLKKLNASAEEQAAHLTQLLKELPAGDIRRGHELFVSKKAACITCHTLGYQGGKLGPDLTSIGKVRNERDLLEAVIYPSASFVRGYEPVIVTLTDGRVLTGIIARESRDEIVLGIDATKTQHVARSDIEEIHPSPTSLMPLGMIKVLTPQEIADLLAFLKTNQR